MEIEKTSIDGVLILNPKVFGDSRGYFMESYKLSFFDELVEKTDFVQTNESYSQYGVLRGLHFQKPPFTQAKLVRVLQGEVLDVAVDLRKGSPTFAEHVAVVLNDENKQQLFVPRGFAHGFVVLSKTALFSYKCDNYYAPDHDAGLRWNDPDIGIDWQIKSDQLSLSKKDQEQPTLQELILNNPFFYKVD